MTPARRRYSQDCLWLGIREPDEWCRHLENEVSNVHWLSERCRMDAFVLVSKMQNITVGIYGNVISPRFTILRR